MSLSNLTKEIQKQKNPQKALFLQRYFKTGKGEYGEGDIFLGLTVPQQRIIAKKFCDLSLEETLKLLKSTIHEYRSIALMILVWSYQKTSTVKKQTIVETYLKHTTYINNWDLVDASASYILGDYLFTKKKDLLYKLAKSKNLWERRIAMLTTYYFIKNNEFYDALKVANILLRDQHDLVHKAVGWMLREIGKRSQKTEELFLKKHYLTIPRTMLRYAIERFSKEKRKDYLIKEKH